MFVVPGFTEMHPTNLRIGESANAALQQSRDILLITRSANLIFQIWPAWRGSRGEAGRRKWGQLTEEESEVPAKTRRPAYIGRSGSHSPCDHIGSEAEHEGANEGADLPRSSLPSPPLLLQATLANAGDTGGG